MGVKWNPVLVCHWLTWVLMQVFAAAVTEVDAIAWVTGNAFMSDAANTMHGACM